MRRAARRYKATCTDRECASFAAMSLHHYVAASREPRYSLLFALPLLLLYEATAALLTPAGAAGVRNGADVLLKTLFVVLGGRTGLTVFGILLLGAGAWFVVQDVRRRPGPLRAGVFAGMFFESVGYAAVFGNVVLLLTAWLLDGRLALAWQAGPMGELPVGTQLVVSLGAGIYEELLFRVLLVSALVALGRRAGWGRPVSLVVAVLGSALIFSGFHYVGPYGDELTLASFTFRTVAGVLLSGLYVARGFGITAWTHALYDVGLALL